MFSTVASPTCLFACLLTVMPTVASAGVLDQEFDGRPYNQRAGVYDTRSCAQTFTVGQAGLLDRLELQVGREQLSPATVPLLVELRRTTLDGSPDLGDAALLASLSFSPVSVSTFALSNFVGQDLGAQAFEVNAGDELAIVLATTSPQASWYLWSTSSGDRATYAGGNAFFRSASAGPFSPLSDQDRGFRAYIAVPEPAALLPIATGVLLLMRRRTIR